jgi:putative hydrolase of the HAD superfamily
MDIRAVAFDVNGTLVRILTDDDDGADLPRRGALPHLPGHRPAPARGQGSLFPDHEGAAARQPGEHPEFDAAGIWRSIIEWAQDGFHPRPAGRAKLEQMPLFLAEMCRGISRHRLGLYPHVREVLDALRERYPLALVTDAQSTYARGELHRVGLLGYFDPIIVSGDHGYRKPDRRLFQFALDGMAVAAENALYVGNDMHRDIFGAREAGLKTVMFDSDQGNKGLP